MNITFWLFSSNTENSYRTYQLLAVGWKHSLRRWRITCRRKLVEEEEEEEGEMDE